MDRGAAARARGGSPPGARWFWSASLLIGGAVLLAPLTRSRAGAPTLHPARESCLDCHAAIEDMHPWHELSCTACHGGDPSATSKESAHVRPARALPTDERLLPEDFDHQYLRFLNPSDLRVVRDTCYPCHTAACDNLVKSLHGTTSGHLSDSLYENGLTESRRTRYSIFPVQDDDGEVPEHGYRQMDGYVNTWNDALRGTLAGHVADLGRKNCMQCHLWSSGTAVRGRLGQDGNYRAAGCAACHVPYADDGLSKSADASIDPFEPGHPLRHEMTAAPTTETCTRCHFGDASIGLHFRGLAQLVPGMPAGPEVPGTTDSLLNGTYYINDPAIVPPDIHHQKGMHCIDCHTVNDVMGDGNLYGFMEHAVEIECVDCHGTFQETTNRHTSRGTPLTHLREENGMVYLVSKVDGRHHWVPQAAHVVDPARPEYNERAARAMTDRHANVECYTCHAGWNVNFFGFHFDRNESFTDLDLLTGKRTPGRCNTQEKVFATLKHFYIGRNDEGMVAPYLVGFSTMGTVHDEQGDTFIDQQLPVTAAGLSGMTMVHHQLHSTRPTARTCVECHRSPATLGLGSGNFRLSRDYAAVTDEMGLHLVAVDRENPELSTAVARVPLPRARKLAAVCDELQGHFQSLYVVLEGAGVAILDASNPAFPRRVALLPTEDPRDVQVRAGVLYVADGSGGLKLFDVRDPRKVRPLGQIATAEARSVEVAWPHAYVADGPAGVRVFDVSDPARPDFVAHLDPNGQPEIPDDAWAVKILFQYSRPDDGKQRRTPAQKLAVVASGVHGPVLFDVSDLGHPRRLFPPHGLPVRASQRSYRDVEVLSRFDLGSPGGEIPTVENDYAYFALDQGGAGFLAIVRITDPEDPRAVTAARLDEPAGSIALASFYNPPFLQRFAVLSTSRAAQTLDISNTEQPEILGPLFSEARRVYDVAFEEFSFDRVVDESGRQLKDISHEGARYFDREELRRLLTVPLERRDVQWEEQ